MKPLAFDFGPVLVWKDDEPCLLLHAEPSDTLAKASEMKEGERWITLRPHSGSGEGHGGIHIKIKTAPDGSAHVISGPGELRGLRLTRLASPEELKKRADQRAEDKRAETKKGKEEAEKKGQADLEASAADPDHAQKVAQDKLARQKAEGERQSKLHDLNNRMLELHEKMLDHAANVTGDDAYQSDRARASFNPAEYETYKNSLKGRANAASAQAMQDGKISSEEAEQSEGAGSVIASRNVRQISGGLKALRRHLIGSLVKDQELREAVLGEDGELDANEIAPKSSGGPGYRQNTTGQAKEAGFEKQDARKESYAAFTDRMGRLQADGQGERAAAIVEMRDATINRAGAERGIKAPVPTDDSLNTPRPVREVSADRVKKHAEDVKQFLSLHDELLKLEREKRAVSLGKDPDATPVEQDALDEFDKPPGAGAEVNASVQGVENTFAAKLEREIHDASKADLTRAFLDAAGQGEEGEGKADAIIRKLMQAHIGAGAHGQLSNATLASLGIEGIDRQVVDALGIDAAAQLTAHAIHRDHPDAASVRDALARSHDDSSLPRMQRAMDLAEAARADAAELELPTVTSSTDAAVIRDLNKQRKEVIGQAHEALGSALGAVEAGAALNLAMKKATRKAVTVRFGAAPTGTVAMQLRALGLEDGDYGLHRDTETNALTASINTSGMDKLTPRLDEKRAAVQREVASIKSGHEDEQDYLPDGFMRRAKSDLVDSPAVPPSFQTPPDFSRGGAQAVATSAAQLYADGYQPSEILRHLLDTTSQDLPADQRANFSRTVAAMIPFAREVKKTAKDGTEYTQTEAVDVDRDPQVHADLATLAGGVSDQSHPQFHAQQTGTDDQTREALFRSIVERPALQAAFSEPGDLGGTPAGRGRAQAIKSYFLKHVSDKMGGMKTADYDEHQQAQQHALIKGLGSCPDKWGGGESDLFGGTSNADGNVVLQLNPHATPEQQTAALRSYGLTPEHYTLNGNAATVSDAGKARLTVPQQIPRLEGEDSDAVLSGGLDSLNPAWVNWQRGVRSAATRFPTSGDLWSQYADTLGGTRRAMQSVQEVMQHDLLTRFTDHHARLTGTQLRVSKKTTSHWEKRLTATDPAEADRIRSRDRSIMEEVRQRDGTGRYRQMGEGGLAGAVQEHVEKLSRQSMLQGGLGFDLGTAKGGGEVQGMNVHDLDVGKHERLSLGNAAEGRIGHMLNGSRWGLKPTDGAGKLMPDLTWGKGTKHVTKQRAVKMLLKSGRLIGWLGAGSGKTGTMLGAFTQAHADGNARKALYVVPSIVRNQFGEAAAKMTKPGQYTWHAEDGDYATRKAHYTGDTHMVVITHQTFRDDMLRLMGEHAGTNPTEAQNRFERMERPARAAMFKAAMEHHGIPTDMLHVDEAHDFLNRAGKQDSTMSKVLEAALDNHKYKAMWTGSPVKNDASEVHDWLSKVDPARFSSRDEFMRRYGVNTQASSEALRRLVDSYSVIDSVKPDIQRSVTWGMKGEDGQDQPIPLTPEQDTAYRGVHAAYERASAANRRGQVDVDAARVLSPRSFDGLEEDQHHAAAARVQSALGTTKYSGLGRAVNEHDAATNAKVQHVLKLASERRGKGGVVFARNRASIHMLKEELEKAGHKVGVIDGSTTTDEKGKVRRAFDAGEHDIVLASDAGATGANLQHRGEYLVNYDLPLTQKTLEQRNARIDRLGQVRPIELHHLVTDTAYDRDNVKRLQTKRELGGILQGEYQDMEDTGLASYIRKAQAERHGEAPPSWEEPLGASISDDARPKGKGVDVPDELPAVPGGGSAPGRGMSA